MNHFYHITFSTKYRKRLISQEIETDMRKALEGKAAELGCRLIEFNTAFDHTHLLIEIPNREDLPKVVGALKGFSSHVLRGRYPSLKDLPALWARGYYAKECAGEDHIQNAIKYIARQKEHLQ